MCIRDSSSVHQLSKVVTLERTDQPGVVFAAGGATTIWVDFPNQKAVTLPDWMRALVSD